MPPPFLALQELTAADLNGVLPVTAAKPSGTPRTSTVAHAADPHLAVSLLASKTYLVIAPLLISSAADAAGDFSYRWSWTGTMSVVNGGVGPANTIATGSIADGEFARAAPDNTTPSAAIPMGASVAGVNALVVATVTVTAAGVLTLEWAQNSSSANATTLEAGSRLTAIPIA